MENGVCQALGMEERWELTPCWIWSNANVPEEARGSGCTVCAGDL